MHITFIVIGQSNSSGDEGFHCASPSGAAEDILRNPRVTRSFDENFLDETLLSHKYYELCLAVRKHSASKQNGLTCLLGRPRWTLSHRAVCASVVAIATSSATTACMASKRAYRSVMGETITEQQMMKMQMSMPRPGVAMTLER